MNETEKLESENIIMSTILLIFLSIKNNLLRYFRFDL